MLVLCGSAQTFMTDLEPVRAAAPALHQENRTGTALLPRGGGVRAVARSGRPGPRLRYRRRHAALSSRVARRRSIRENLLSLFGDPGGPLVDSAPLVLHTDLGDANASYRALAAIANGDTNATTSSKGSHHERTRPRPARRAAAGHRSGFRSPKARSRGADLRPHRSVFSLLVPLHRANRAAIDRGFGEQLVDDVILPGLDDHMGPVFEDWRGRSPRGSSRGRSRALDLGSWWSNDGRHEIDIVGMGLNKPTFIGTVKWRHAPLGQDVYANLADHARARGATSIPGSCRSRRRRSNVLRESRTSAATRSRPLCARARLRARPRTRPGRGRRTTRTTGSRRGGSPRSSES